MANLWLPGFDRIPSGGGSWSDDDEMKVVWHSTEGSLESAKAVFAQHSAPHLLVSPPSRPDGPARIQYVPLNRSSFALRNAPGGVETGRDGVIQIEIVGFAAQMHDLGRRDLEWLGEKVLAPILEAVPSIGVNHPKFWRADEGVVLATTSSPVRMGGREWDRFSGQCGHQHVPENDHWDPGGLDIDTIIDAAGRGGEGLDLMDRKTRNQLREMFKNQDRRQLTQIRAELRAQDWRTLQALAADGDGGIDEQALRDLLEERDAHLVEDLVPAIVTGVAEQLEDLDPEVTIDTDAIASAVRAELADALAGAEA